MRVTNLSCKEILVLNLEEDAMVLKENELKTLWMATEMLDEMLTILLPFLDINKGLLLSNTTNEEDSE
ncbi:hypothetical protein FQA39_LY02178 [Lamprigera yunnana]|nr:hypothetical protein FQA39_LY02178 [Lamprigera yunnana]